jgi:hypothetical protein
VDGVVIETSPDSANTRIQIEAPDAGGEWTMLSDHFEESVNPIRTSLRRAAAAELKARGIHYVLIKPENPGADDFRRYTTAWGFHLAGVVEPARLYFIP